MRDLVGNMCPGSLARGLAIGLVAVVPLAFAQVAGAQVPASPSQCVWVLGDSLAGALAPYIEALAPGRRVIADGFGGQSTAPIAARAGALPVNIVVQDGRVASAGATKVVSVVPEILTNSSPSRPQASIEGRLQGVPGTLTWQRNVGYSFLPSAVAQEIRVSNPARFLVDLSEKEPCLMVLWAGRNGVTADVPKTLAGLTALADGRRRRNAPFLILTVYNTPLEGRSTPPYDNIRRLNRELLSRYPDHIVDVRRWLIEQGMAAVGAEPDSRTKAELDEDTVPSQLLADGLHPNREAMRAIARHVVSEIERRKL